MCQAFPIILRGPAWLWYNRLRPSLVSSFDQLVKEFELKFLTSARPKSSIALLLGLSQKDDEPLSQFIICFAVEIRGVLDAHPSFVIQAFLMGLQPSKFFWSLIERPMASILEMLQGHLGHSIRKSREPSPRPQGPVEKQINIIIGGPTSKGDSSSRQKSYAWAIVEKCLRNINELEITFRSGEVEYPNHDDALVISTRVANTGVKRIMVGTGSSAYILYFGTFEKLGLTEKDLVPMASTLTEFIGHSISPLNTTAIPVTIGEEPKFKTLMVTFMVVGLPSTYNAILGHPTINKLRVILSTYHCAMKFPTRAGVGEIGSNPWESR
ncbi:hypothetical protein BHM03_00047528 [Ensete ventricosum]|nr:hypothetical protein BHM03_00047528 [Ensete ventricosum]